MTKDQLDESWIISSYNENTKYQLDYYINPNDFHVGSIGYLYKHEYNFMQKMEIVNIIRRSDNMQYYDEIVGDDSIDILVDGEQTLRADTAAEFITNDDSYLVWFNYNWEWPLKNYFARYEISQLEVGDAVMLIEEGEMPRNVLILEKTDTHFAVGENDLCCYASYGIKWRLCPPSAGRLDYPAKNMAWSEAIFRMVEEFGLDAEENRTLTEDIYQNLNACDSFIDSEISSMVAKATAEDYAKSHWNTFSDEEKSFWKNMFSELTEI